MQQCPPPNSAPVSESRGRTGSLGRSRPHDKVGGQRGDGGQPESEDDRSRHDYREARVHGHGGDEPESHGGEPKAGCHDEGWTHTANAAGHKPDRVSLPHG